MTAKLSYPDHKADLCGTTSIHYVEGAGGPRIPAKELYVFDCDVKGAGVGMA